MGAIGYPASLYPSLITSDTAISTVPTKVYWMTISNTHATDPATVQLNDSDDDSGTDIFAIDIEQGQQFHMIFDPPIQFAVALWADITGGTVKVNVGYYPSPA
jgi:hypothetical protein